MTTNARLSEDDVYHLQSQLMGCPKQDSLWRHYKGDLYFVMACSLEATTYEIQVTYRNFKTGYVWTRPLAEWNEIVDVGGQRVRRFEPVERGNNGTDRQE